MSTGIQPVKNTGVQEHTNEIPPYTYESPGYTSQNGGGAFSDQTQAMEKSINKMQKLLSPHSVMFVPAIILDALGPILVILILAAGVGEIVSWITDIVGIVIFSLWIVFKIFLDIIMDGIKQNLGISKKESATTKIKELVSERLEHREKMFGKSTGKNVSKTAGKSAVKRVAKKVFTKVLGKTLIRFGIVIVGEIIPIVGGLIPFWTIFVYQEITSDD